MPRNILRPLLTIMLCSLVLAPRPDSSGTVSFSHVPKKSLHNVRVLAGPDGGTAYTIKDLTYRSSSDPLITDLVLSFNTPSSRLARDDMRHYRINRGEYDFVTGDGALGKGCARFFKKEHGVSIETAGAGWLGSCDDLGSFTIEFRIKPHEVRDGAVIFSRVGYFSGTRRGIEIFVANGTIAAGLYGVFDKPTSDRYDVVLRRGTPISKGVWTHFSLSFDRLSGKLATCFNGQEAEVRYITTSGKPFNGVYTPSFGSRDTDGRIRCLDSPPAVIGADFSGCVDEFRISYRQYEDLEKSTALAYRNYHAVGRIGRIPFNVEGVITSPVYRFEGTGTLVREIRWNEERAQDTFIWMEFRISDCRFLEDDTGLKWYRIENNQKKIFLMKTGEGEYLRGRYYQWRAHLVASPDGARAPRFSGMEIDYRPDLPPAPPLFVEVAATGDRFITLRWKKNVDHDLLGYRIYYGTDSGKMDGLISTINGARIANGPGNIVQVKIDNDLIEENRGRDRKGKLSFPFLQNTVLYYFSVTAYDSYKPDTPYNHESALSKPVAARPYAGTDIR
ncbi:MAG: hypothetical protein JXA07_06535 [Spirochaetes bacterium]|nr:hypothetical protein [Spirochaetota bacterium]